MSIETFDIKAEVIGDLPDLTPDRLDLSEPVSFKSLFEGMNNQMKKIEAFSNEAIQKLKVRLRESEIAREKLTGEKGTGGFDQSSIRVDRPTLMDRSTTLDHSTIDDGPNTADVPNQTIMGSESLENRACTFSKDSVPHTEPVMTSNTDSSLVISDESFIIDRV